MENSFPCICGHPFEVHYDPDDDSTPDIIYGQGKCQFELPRPTGSHHCSSCGFDPEDYCPCLEFKPDNLKYLEDQSANEH